MINTLREILHDSKFIITKSNETIVLFQGNFNAYPEDYIQIEKETDKYVVSEVHRDTKQIKVETKIKDEAVIYAVILLKRLYDNVTDRMASRSIRGYLKSGDENKAIKYISNNFDDSIYSINSEENVKISLIKLGDKVDVKFAGEYIVEDVTLSRGYVVLYNYCEKLYHISKFYDELKNKLDCNLNRDRILRLYILGK